jgi:hypothetical protein
MSRYAGTEPNIRTREKIAKYGDVCTEQHEDPGLCWREAHQLLQREW